MPFRNAYWFILGLLVFTFVAFWPSYFAKLPSAKIAWHVHAASAVAWTLFATLQSWSIHNNQWALHRKAGLALFVLFPFFLIGGMMAIHAEAVTLASDIGDPQNAVIAQFGFFDPLANVGFALLFYGGLQYRKNVQLHARYMVATLMFVVAPVVWRLLGKWVPFFNSETPETAYRFSYAMAAGNLGSIALACYLYSLAPKFGRPFALVIGFTVVQAILFETVGRMDFWAPMFAQVANANLPLLLALTGISGIGIAWHGWKSGSRPDAPNSTGGA